MGFSHRSNQSRHWCLMPLHSAGMFQKCSDFCNWLGFPWISMGYYTCNWLVDASRVTPLFVDSHHPLRRWVRPSRHIVCWRPRLSSHLPYQQGTDLPEGPVVFPVCSQCVPSVFPVCSQCVPSSKPRWFGGCASVGFPVFSVGRFLSQSVGLLRKHERPTRTVFLGEFWGAGALHQLVANWWRKKTGLPSGNDWHTLW